jgi:hypothetical protein
MTTKRTMIYDPDTRRYKRIKPIRCDYQDVLQELWEKYHLHKSRRQVVSAELLTLSFAIMIFSVVAFLYLARKNSGN